MVLHVADPSYQRLFVSYRYIFSLLPLLWLVDLTNGQESGDSSLVDRSVAKSIKISASEVAEVKPSIPRIILDTDIGGDIDDVGALAVLHWLAANKECEILATISDSASDSFAIPCLDALNTWFGRSDIPLAMRKGEPLREEETYTRFLAAKYPWSRTAEQSPTAVELYRRILSDQPDHSVTVSVIGRLFNIYNLMSSPPDAISPLSGMELINQKVKEFALMAGEFPTRRHADGPENNLTGELNGVPVSPSVIEGLRRPIVFCGFEIGSAIRTGKTLQPFIGQSPVADGYQWFFQHPPSWAKRKPQDQIAPHASFDQATVLYAVRGLKDYWKLQRGGHCHVFDDQYNEWRTTEAKEHAYLLKQKPPAEIAKIISVMMESLPHEKGKSSP
jgi:hypothetical protein